MDKPIKRKWYKQDSVLFWVLFAIVYFIASYYSSNYSSNPLDEIFDALIFFISLCMARIEFKLNNLTNKE